MKRFYVGQPLIIKENQKKVNLAYDDKDDHKPYRVISRNECGRVICGFYHQYELEPSTEFKFSQIIAGLEQGYFEVGTEFQSEYYVLVVRKTTEGLGLKIKTCNSIHAKININTKIISNVWKLVEQRREMTLEEIEAELGYKIKLKDNGGN